MRIREGFSWQAVCNDDVRSGAAHAGEFLEPGKRKSTRLEADFCCEAREISGEARHVRHRHRHSNIPHAILVANITYIHF